MQNILSFCSQPNWKHSLWQKPALPQAASVLSQAAGKSFAIHSCSIRLNCTEVHLLYIRFDYLFNCL